MPNQMLHLVAHNIRYIQNLVYIGATLVTFPLFKSPNKGVYNTESSVLHSSPKRGMYNAILKSETAC